MLVVPLPNGRLTPETTTAGRTCPAVAVKPAVARRLRGGLALAVGRRARRDRLAGRLVAAVLLAAGAADRGRNLLRLAHRQRDLGIRALRRALDHDGRAGRELRPQHEVRERVLDVALDRPAERTGTHGRVPALLDEQVLGVLGELQLQLALRERLADAAQEELDDRLDLLLLQLVEHDHVVDAVEELGAEDLLQLSHDPVLHVVVRDPGLVVGDGEAERRVASDLLRADVRRHDHDRVTEVDRPPLRVRQAPVLQDLQEDVEDVRVRLLDLVEQEHAVRLAAHGLGELAALVVADVARRRADQARDGVLLHVLGHVDAHHRVLVAEEELRERPRQLRLAHARRAEEDEGAGRPLRVLEARARAADRLRDDLDGGVLADDALVELLLHAHELLRLGFGELEHRDAGPHRDDVGDLLLADGGTLRVALAPLPLLLELALLVGQLALGVAEVRGLLELLRLDRGLLGAARLLDLLLELPVHGRGGHRLDAHARSGLVDEVDRLVGQLPVGDVPVRELRGRLERLVGDVHLVVLLVAVTQALEDLHGLLGRRLVDADLLEAPLQGGVALEVLAVLVERRRADGLELAAGERRLEDRRRVDRALGGTRADEVVELVDEQDDVPALGDLLHHLLQALLELAAVLRAGDEGREVQRVDLLALEQLGHVGVGDALGEAFDHRGLAHARLADEHRVVLGAAREDLHDPLDLGLAADDGVELALGGELGQVAPELIEQLRGLLALARRAGRTCARAALAALTAAAGAREHPDDLVADLLRVGVEVEQDARCDALVLADEAEQDVLRADVVVAEAQCLAECELEHLLRARGERDLPGRHFLAGADDAHDLRTHALHSDVEGLEDTSRKSLLLAQQAEQDVLGADVVVLERSRFLLRENDDLTGSFCESLEHVLLVLPAVRVEASASVDAWSLGRVGGTGYRPTTHLFGRNRLEDESIGCCWQAMGQSTNVPAGPRAIAKAFPQSGRTTRSTRQRPSRKRCTARRPSPPGARDWTEWPAPGTITSLPFGVCAACSRAQGSGV